MLPLDDESLFGRTCRIVLIYASAFVAECWFPRALLDEGPFTTFPDVTPQYDRALHRLTSQRFLILSDDKRYVCMLHSTQQYAQSLVPGRAERASLYNGVEATMYHKLEQLHTVNDPLERMALLQHAQVMAQCAIMRRSGIAYELCSSVARISLLCEDAHAEQFLRLADHLEVTMQIEDSTVAPETMSLLAAFVLVPTRPAFACRYLTPRVQRATQRFGAQHPVTLEAHAVQQRFCGTVAQN